jgi:cytochrome P450 family 135
VRALPPGPTGGRLAQTIAFHRDPLRVLRDAQARFGDVFTLRMATTGPIVVIAEPELARVVQRLPVAGRARREVLPQASARSVFGGDGEQWESARDRVAEWFAPDATKREAIEQIAREHVDRWPRGRPFRLLPRMRKLADEVFVREVLHGPPELIPAIGSLLYTPGNPPLSIPDRGLLGWLVNAEFRRRRARIKLDDELLVLLMAAQEPMAVALTRVTLAGTYSRAVAQETLRRFPPALASLRELNEPLDGLPAGTLVMVPLPLVQPEGPFGGGERQCLGQHLAWTELDAIVPIALGTGLRPVGPQPEKMVLRGTILVPRRSGLVRA